MEPKEVGKADGVKSKKSLDKEFSTAVFLALYKGATYHFDQTTAKIKAQEQIHVAAVEKNHLLDQQTSEIRAKANVMIGELNLASKLIDSGLEIGALRKQLEEKDHEYEKLKISAGLSFVPNSLLKLGFDAGQAKDGFKEFFFGSALRLMGTFFAVILGIAFFPSVALKVSELRSGISRDLYGETGSWVFKDGRFGAIVLLIGFSLIKLLVPLGISLFQLVKQADKIELLSLSKEYALQG